MCRCVTHHLPQVLLEMRRSRPKEAGAAPEVPASTVAAPGRAGAVRRPLISSAALWEVR